MFGIRDTGGGTDAAMFGFPATTFTIRTIMPNGFLVTGSTEVEGGIGSKATGGIKTPTLITSPVTYGSVFLY